MAIQDGAASGGRERWLQLGLVAATAAAPLIARWRSLRDSDRAEELRERAAALRVAAADRFADAAQAAQALQLSLQQSLRKAPEPSTAEESDERRAALAQLASLAAAAPTDDAAHNRRLRATFWLAGATAGLLAAGAITYIIIRNRALARAEDDALVELSLDHLAHGPQTAPAPSDQPVTEAPASLEPEFAPPPEFSDKDEAGALWVGDIMTRAYMPLDTQRGSAMPDPNRRIYFATESQAVAAGYHRSSAAPVERE
jgi:hypothetical protein